MVQKIYTDYVPDPFSLTDEGRRSAAESIAYLRCVFPPKAVFESLVQEGVTGDNYDDHRIQGDDLAGASWHLHNLMTIFDLHGEDLEFSRRYSLDDARHPVGEPRSNSEGES